MRESLTIFAIALIVVLSALLVGPYLVDWNNQRDWLAAKLSHAVGAEVRIAGPIDVKLLPRPIFRASDVSIAGAGPQAPRFSAERLDAELSLNGLLQGAAEFVDARLTAPRIELTMRPDGSIVAPAVESAHADRFQFSHFAIDRGSIAILDEAGRPTAMLSGITANGEAETLRGPLKLNGSAETEQGAVTFRFSTGSYQGGKLRIHLAADHQGAWSHADADGALSFGVAGAKGRPATAPTFQGSLGLSGDIRIAAGAAPVPWRITATENTADVRNLAAPAIEVRAGADGRALVATGSALFSLGDKPAGIARFRARQLDLDRIAVPPEVAPDTPRPSAAQWLAALRTALDGSTSLPFGLKVDAAVDAVTTGDLTLTDAAAAIDAQPGALPQVTLSIAGPNASRASLDGTVETGAVPAFQGQVDVATRDMAATAGWMAPLAPGLADWLGDAYRGQAGALKGKIDISAVGLVARDAILTWAGTTLDGSLSITAATATDRPHVFADLKADSFDAAQWPGLGQLLRLCEPFDFNLGLASDAVTLARADAGPTQTARIALHALKKGGEISVDRFALSGFGGAAVDATATLRDGTHLHADGQVTAGEAARVADALKQIAPGAVSDALAARAAALSPLQLGLTFDGTVGSDGSVQPDGVSAKGSAASTRFSVAFAPLAAGGGAASADATLVIDAPDAAQVLKQVGWQGAGSLGALHLEARGQGSLADGFAGKVAIALPKTTAAFSGQVGAVDGHGRLTFDGSDLGPLLRSAGYGEAAAGRAGSFAADLSWSDAAVGLHGLTGRVAGSAVTGDFDVTRGTPSDAAAPLVTGAMTLDTGNLGVLIALGVGAAGSKAGSATEAWSSAPFGAAPAWPSSTVALRIGSLELWPGLVGRDTGLTLQLRPGVVTLAQVSTHLLGGAGSGTVTIRRIGPSASASGQVAFDKILVALPDLSGRLSTKLTLAGTGQTPAALAASLAGDGTLTLASATIPHLAPGALDRVAAGTSPEGSALDEGPVKDALTKELDKGPAVLGDVTAPATVAAGVLRVANVKATLAEATIVGDAAFNLADLSFSLRTSLTAAVLPRDWKGDPPQATVSWKGPLGAPVRDLDAGAFLNGLAARAIAREQDRIDLMKDDLRERAFFARRLRQMEADQKAAHEAAAASKAVPQPPSRPTEIRLPRPPDVGAPSFPQSLQPTAQQDGITQFLKGLPDGPKAPSRLNSAIPSDSASSPRAPAKPAAPVADPGQLY